MTFVVAKNDYQNSSSVPLCFVFSCKVPGCDDNFHAEYEPSWLENAVPYKDSVPRKCQRYIRHHNATTNALFRADYNCSSGTFDRSQIEECHEWIFASKENTIVKEVSGWFLFLFTILAPNLARKLYTSNYHVRKITLLLEIVAKSILN